MKNFTFTTIAPTRIIEGKNLINNKLLANYEHIFGKTALLIVKNDVLKKFPQLKNLSNKIIQFKNDCTYQQTDEILKKIKNKNISSIIGCGGGKAIDQAKVIASKISKPIITIPTSSATGAATSALSAMYTKNGACLGYEIFNSSPDLVVIDYSLILDSPCSFMKFGIADALAKYYESMASTGGKSNDIFVETALNLATRIKEYIFKYSATAIKDAQNNKISDVFKNITKINIILAPIVGGFGGENCRAVASHAFNNAMTQLPKMQKFMHGEIVALGNIFQLMLENSKHSKLELQKLLKLYKQIGLMQDFTYFNTKLNHNELKIFLKHLTSKKETLQNMKKKITTNQIINCLKELKVI